MQLLVVLLDQNTGSKQHGGRDGCRAKFERVAGTLGSEEVQNEAVDVKFKYGENADVNQQRDLHQAGQQPAETSHDDTRDSHN